MSGSFFVLLSRPEQLQPEKIAAALASFEKVPLLDARRAAKLCWGFLGERLEEPRAKLLVAHATQNGLDTILLDETELPVLPPAQNVRSARLADDAFHYATGSSAEEFRADWADVRLVSAVGLKEVTEVTKTVKEGVSGKEKMIRLGITLATGIPVGLGGSKEVKKVVKEQELYFYGDVFARAGGAWRRLHVDAQGFNFACLGERKQPNVMANFRLFMEELRRRASGALANRGAAVTAGGQPWSAAGYESADVYDKECRWLLALAARRP